MSTAVKPLGRALRLEVEGDPLAGALVNLVPNVDGALGGWGWVTPVAGSSMQGYPNDSGVRALRFVPAPGGVAQWFTTEPMRVTAGWFVAASWHVPAAGAYHRARFEFLRGDGTLISSSPQSNYVGGGAVDATYSHGPFAIPALTVHVRLRFDVYGNNAGGNPAAGQYLYLDRVTVAQAATGAELGTNVTNLVGNPSFEADLAGWTGTGSVAIARDTTEYQHGVASVHIVNTNRDTRTNWLGNPSAEVGMSNIGAEFGAVITREAGGTSGGACWRVVGPNTVASRQRRAGLLNSGVGVNPSTDIVRARADIRFDAGWNANSKAELIVRWYANLGATEIGSSSLGAVVNPVAGAWYTLDNSTLVPPGATYCRVSVESYQGGQGGVVGPADSMWVDAMLLELGGAGKYAGGPYFDGSTPDTATVINDFAGTPHVSGFSTQTIAIGPSGNPGVVSAAMLAYGAQYHTVSAYVKRSASSEAGWVGLTLDWYAGGALVRHDAVSNIEQLTDTAWHRVSRTVAAPVDADTVTVGVFVGFSDPLSSYYVDAVMVELGQVLHPFQVGSISNSDLSYIEPVPYVNVLGTTHDITVTREGMNVGTLSAHIVDSSLDPTRSDIIRPGRAVRLMAYDLAAAAWRHVFTGKASHATVEYELTTPAESKRARIELTAVDSVQALGNQKRTEGVAHIAELPYVLEGAGVPWNVNGSGSQVPAATVVATNENATALDQVAVTRDSELGYAWVDRMGVLYAADPAHLSATARPELDEDVYADIGIGYDSASLVNEVSLHLLVYDAEAETTSEVVYGPYRDEDSIRAWGVSSADYTVQGIAEDEPTLAAFAQRILDANATPQLLLHEMQLHVELADNWAGVTSWYAWADLYDLVHVTCARASMAAEPARIVGITHTISGPDSKWQTALQFNAPVTVASPTSTPTVGAGVATGSGGGGGTPTGPAGGDLTGLYPNPELAANAVGPAEIVDGGVGTNELADQAVTSAKIKDATIVAGDIAPGVIPASLPPSGPAGGDLTGAYPNPTIGPGKVTSSHIADGTIVDTDVAVANKDGAVGTPSLRTLGAGAQQAAAGNDARLSDTRTPKPHAVTHQPGGADPMAVDAAAGTGSLRTLGAGALQAAPGTDARLSDSRAPSGPAGGSLTGTYPNPTLAANTVGAAQITDGTVGNAELAPNAVDSSKIVDGTIVAADLAPGVIPSVPSSLPPSGPAGGQLTGTYPNPSVAANVITSGHIVDGTIVTADLSAALASSIANAAVDTLVVHKAGAETITGVKTLDAPLVQTYQGAQPATPPAGHATGPYFGADGLPYFLTPGGVVVPLNIGDPQTALHLNPSFELWGPPLTNWDTFWQNNSTVATETVDVLFGSRAITVTNAAGATTNNQLLLSSVFTVAPGDAVTVGAWARLVAGNATIEVGIMSAASGTPGPFDGVSTSQNTGSQPLTATYLKYGKAFTIPAGHTVCRLTLRVVAADTGGATARLDASTSSRTGASTAVLPGNSWPKETARACSTSTANPLSAAPATVDGVNLAIGDRVLRATPTGDAADGIYTVVTVGTGANGVWARATDATTPAQLAGAEVAVAAGALYGGTRWGTTLKATDIVGVSVMRWAIIRADLPAWRSVTLATQYSMSTAAQVVGWNGANNGSGLALSANQTQFVVATPGVYYVTSSCTFQQTGGAGNIWHIVNIIHKRSGAQLAIREAVGSTLPGDFVDVVAQGHFDALAGDVFEVWVTAQYLNLSNIQANRSAFDAHKLGGAQ